MAYGFKDLWRRVWAVLLPVERFRVLGVIRQHTEVWVWSS